MIKMGTFSSQVAEEATIFLLKAYIYIKIDNIDKKETRGALEVSLMMMMMMKLNTLKYEQKNRMCGLHMCIF